MECAGYTADEELFSTIIDFFEQLEIMDYGIALSSEMVCFLFWFFHQDN